LILGRCLRVAWRHRCTKIVVDFPNEEFLLVGYLAAKVTGAQLYPYFHNTYVENRKGLGQRFARWVQRRVFARAEHVFVMSEGMADLFKKRYPGLPCSPLLHTFNEAIPQFAALPEPGCPLRFVISGSINESCLDATNRLCEAIARVDNASLTFLSGTSREALKKMGLISEGVEHATVSRDQLVDRLRAADILLLPHGFSGPFSPEEYETIFPTRTIEYLISGRPILAHSPADSFLTRFLKDKGCALVVEEPRVEALLQAVERLRSNRQLREELVQNALRAAVMFHAPRVAMTARERLWAVRQ
jgi:hypothetical protein